MNRLISALCSGNPVFRWLRRKRLARVSAAWRGLADNHRAKRLIKKAGIVGVGVGGILAMAL